jgi:folate-binding protein YgfZ
MTQAAKEAPSKGYTAVRDGGAGIIDLSARGRLLVSGRDAEMFLNGLVTNDMKTLAVGSSMPALFSSVQGRLIAAVRITHTPDGFLIDTEKATRDAVYQLVSRFVLAGDFRVNNLVQQTVFLSIQGQRAAEIVSATLGEQAAKLDHGKMTTVEFESSALTIISATHTAEQGFDFIIDANTAPVLRQAWVDAGAETVSSETQEVLRIEAGIPRYGIDMDQNTVVSETNLDDSISFTKGCYVGQEIIIRIKHRGHVAKKLTGLLLDYHWDLVDRAEIISDDHEEIGHITSYAYSPKLSQRVALGYVKYDYLEDGARVWIDRGEKQVAAEIAEVPMVRGSWYQTLDSTPIPIASDN